KTAEVERPVGPEAAPDERSDGPHEEDPEEGDGHGDGERPRGPAQQGPAAGGTLGASSRSRGGDTPMTLAGRGAVLEGGHGAQPTTWAVQSLIHASRFAEISAGSRAIGSVGTGAKDSQSAGTVTSG